MIISKHKKKPSKKELEEKEFVKAIDRYSRIDHCLLCGRKMESACNSHVVPQFVLKEIAEDGRVTYGYSLSKVSVTGLGRLTGINNAHTFRLICRDCDKTKFANYENPDNIVNFDTLPLNIQKKVLCEMAIKTHLAHISMKYRRLVSLDMANQGKIAELESQGKLISAERLDINEHEECINKLTKATQTNKNPFEIIYNTVLDYKTKLATQTIINFNFDINGKQIFDPFYMTPDNECRYFYLMIIPYKGKTRILFYIEKNNIKNVSSIIEQFNMLSDEEKLHFLFISLIIHDQQFYMSPSLSNLIFKKDKAIVKLYDEIEKSLKYQFKLKDFRKYKNYLSREFEK